MKNKTIPVNCYDQEDGIKVIVKKPDIKVNVKETKADYVADVYVGTGGTKFTHYTGETTIYPTEYDQTLNTAGKLVDSNIIVKEIPDVIAIAIDEVPLGDQGDTQSTLFLQGFNDILIIEEV